MLAEDTIPQPLASVSRGLIFVQELKRPEVILRVGVCGEKQWPLLEEVGSRPAGK